MHLYEIIDDKGKIAEKRSRKARGAKTIDARHLKR